MKYNLPFEKKCQLLTRVFPDALSCRELVMVNQYTSAETMKEENVIIDNYQYLFLFRSQYIYCAPKTVCESFSFSTFCNLHELAINVRGQCYSSQYKCFLLKIGICNLIGYYDGICIF